MRRSLIWTVTLTAATCLTSATWAQHGGGAGIHGGGGHGGPPEFGSTAGPRSDHGNPTAGSGSAANFQTRLANNTTLASRLQPLLPPNTTLQAAAMGFKNQGQFIAALQVSHNLHIPFDQLKTEMTGTQHDSLGQAIHDLRPDLGTLAVNRNVKLADREAKTDVRESHEAAESAK